MQNVWRQSSGTKCTWTLTSNVLKSTPFPIERHKLVLENYINNKTFGKLTSIVPSNHSNGHKNKLTSTWKGVSNQLAGEHLHKQKLDKVAVINIETFQPDRLFCLK